MEEHLSVALTRTVMRVRIVTNGTEARSSVGWQRSAREPTYPILRASVCNMELREYEMTCLETHRERAAASEGGSVAVRACAAA